MKFSIRTLYLYLFSFIGLLITVFGAIRLVNLGIKTFVFPDSDNYSYMTEYAPKRINPDGSEVMETEQERNVRLENQRKDITRQRQRELTEAISFILVGIPLYGYHWRTIQSASSTDKK